jgi:hypothetical protein
LNNTKDCTVAGKFNDLPPKTIPDIISQKGEINGQERVTPEQIINKLREAEILIKQGATIAVFIKKIGVSVFDVRENGTH